MANKSGKNHGREIGDIVRSSLNGDLSRLSDLGPAIGGVVEDAVGGVVDAVKDISNPNLETRGAGNQPAPREENYPQGSPYNQNQPPKQPTWQPTRQPWQGKYNPARPTGPKLSGGVAQVVLGTLGVAVFGIGALVVAGFTLAIGLRFLPLAIGLAVMAGVAAIFLGGGVGKGKLKARVQKYYALFKNKAVLTYEEIAAQVGVEPKQIRKDIRAAKKVGALPDVRVDNSDTCLIRGDDAWQHYLNSEKTAAEREKEEAERQRRMADPATAGIEAFRSEGIETIRKIRNANEAIPGEEISDKLSKLEGTCARIFSYVEQHPEKLPDTRKFMNYYLPTTLKLVEKYRQYEEMDYQPENVKEAKAEIESTLDTIDSAFNKLLESLYDHDTLDISTDITVMKKMLEQEGLVGNTFEIEETDDIKLTTD